MKSVLIKVYKLCGKDWIDIEMVIKIRGKSGFDVLRERRTE